MDIRPEKPTTLYRLKTRDGAFRVSGDVLGQGRFLLGRSESCDVIVDGDSVSAVHAVLEIDGDKIRLYDMNSTNGSWIGDKKVVTAEIKPSEGFALANVELTLTPYKREAALPPVLDTLEPASGEASTLNPPQLPPGPSRSLPVTPKVAATMVPYIVYPLAADPRAEQSEYIFEEESTLYPIFRYDTARQAVEVIILFKDRVYAVDYLPDEEGSYMLAGYRPEHGDLEFPYLARAEKVRFVDLQRGQVQVHKLSGYEVFHLSENQSRPVNQGVGVVELKPQDILRFSKGDLQIYLRQVAAPPEVKAAPLMRRDPSFKSLLLLLFFFSGLLTTGMLLAPRDEQKKEEIKKELAPARVASILYKVKPLEVPVEVKPVPTPVKKPEPLQTPPVAINRPQPEPPKEPKPVVKNSTQDNNKAQGSKTAAETRPVSKGNPNSAEKAPGKMGGSAAGAKGPQVKIGTSKSAYQNDAANGPVEVYKSADFASTVNQMVAKGGTLTEVDGVKGAASGFGGENIVGDGIAKGQGSGTLQRATVTNNMGSLTGVANGVIGKTSKGAEGLSSKSTIYTAGIPAETVVLGSMDPDIIRRILMDNLPKFRFCYQSELERSGKNDVQGVLKLNFVIGASGHVAQAGVDDARDLPVPVKRCVVEVLRGIQFPEPLGGGVVEVKQPVSFYPKRR